MTSESEPRPEAQLILPQDAGETERELYKKFNEETLTMKEATDARDVCPSEAPASIGIFYHDLINLLMSRYESHRTVLEDMITRTDEHELSLINAYDLDYPELAIFQAWKNGKLREVTWPDAFDMSEKLNKATTPRVKTSLNHFYGWMRNKLAIELGQEELAEMRRRKLEGKK